MDSTISPAQIEVSVLPNDTRNKNQLKGKVPFPIYLSLTLSQKEDTVVKRIQVALDEYPKDKVRYRSVKSKYSPIIEYRCYFNCLEVFEHFAQNTLEPHQLVKTPMIGDVIPFTTINLSDIARAIKIHAQNATPIRRTRL